MKKLYDIFSDAFDKKASQLDKSLVYWAKREANFSCDTSVLRKKLAEVWKFYYEHGVETMFFDALAECPDRTEKVWEAMCKADEERRKADYISSKIHELAVSGVEYLSKADYKKLFNSFYGYDKMEVVDEDYKLSHYWSISVYKDSAKKALQPVIPFLAED